MTTRWRRITGGFWKREIEEFTLIVKCHDLFGNCCWTFRVLSNLDKLFNTLPITVARGEDFTTSREAKTAADNLAQAIVLTRKIHDKGHIFTPQNMEI